MQPPFTALLSNIRALLSAVDDVINARGDVTTRNAARRLRETLDEEFYGTLT